MLHDRIGFVYFIRAPINGYIKIGFTLESPDLRFFALQSASPVPLEPMGIVRAQRRGERRLHIRFAHLRVRGEWFEPGPELMAFIAEKMKPWPPSHFGSSKRGRAEWLAQQERILEPLFRPITPPEVVHPDAARFIAENRAKALARKATP